MTFDKPLQAGAVLGTQFTLFTGTQEFAGVLATAAGNVCSGTMALVGALLHAPEVVFVDTAGDLRGVDTLQVADFAQAAVVT